MTRCESPDPRADGCPAGCASTQELFNRVVALYFDVIQAHPAVLELPNPKALTALEKLTHATQRNPDPVMPLSDVAGHIPAMFRLWRSI